MCVCVFALSAKDTVCTTDTNTLTQSHDSLILLCRAACFYSPDSFSLSLSFSLCHFLALSGEKKRKESVIYFNVFIVSFVYIL